MKRLKSIIAVIAAGATFAVSNIAAFAQTYSDVPTTHWAYNAVERCSSTHWFDGYPDGSFKPNGEILRSEAMKVFVQILGLPLKEVTSSTYYDVKPTDWYAPYVEAGSYLFPERTANDGQKKFQPTMPITREDAIYALVQTLGYDSETKFADESVLNMFSDQRSISTNLKRYIAWAVSDGLASGYDDGTIGAQDPLSRAEFATILYRANVTHGFNNTGTVAKVISGIDVVPSTMEQLMIGDSFEITGTASYSNGDTEDYTNSLHPYAEGASGIVTINKNKVTAVGEGTVIIKFSNEELSGKEIVIIVSKPSDAPVITVDTYDAETEDDSITIAGSVTDTSGTPLTMTANGLAVGINSDGSFKTTADLVIGSNSIVLSAKNGYDNEATNVVSVVRTAAATPEPTVTPTPTATPAPTAEPEPDATAEPVEDLDA